MSQRRTALAGNQAGSALVLDGWRQGGSVAACFNELRPQPQGSLRPDLPPEPGQPLVCLGLAQLNTGQKFISAELD